MGLTFSVSGVSLYVNFKNRKNAIREHLYKEQLAFFLKLGYEFTILCNHIQDVIVEKYCSDEKDEKIEAQIDKINSLTDSYEFIVPNEILTAIYKAEREANKLSLLFFSKDGEIIKKRY